MMAQGQSDCALVLLVEAVLNRFQQLRRNDGKPL
jgi:hypothetical protein